MTKERFNEIKSVVESKLGNEIDVDLLSSVLEEMNVTLEEAQITCAALLPLRCLMTFEYKHQTFFSDAQMSILNNADEFNFVE